MLSSSQSSQISLYSLEPVCLFTNSKPITPPFSKSQLTQRCAGFSQSQFLRTFEMIVISLCSLYKILVDLIPSFIYFHAGAALTAIQDEIKNKKELILNTGNVSLNNEVVLGDDSNCTLLQIWSKYNRVRQLVKRSDSIFGWMLLFDFGIKFFMVCTLCYSLLASFKNNPNVDAVIVLLMINHPSPIHFY